MSPVVLSCPEPHSKEGQSQEEGEGNGVSLGKAHPPPTSRGGHGNHEMVERWTSLADLNFTYFLCDVGQVTHPLWVFSSMKWEPGCSLCTASVKVLDDISGLKHWAHARPSS